MDISGWLLADRARRIAVLALAALIAVGFLIFGETTAIRILGFSLALLLGVIVKILAETQARLSRIEGKVTSGLADLAKKQAQATKAVLTEIERHVDRVEAEIWRANRDAAKWREDSDRRLADQTDEISRQLDDMALRLERGLAPRRQPRAGGGGDGGGLRELGISASLSGLSAGVEGRGQELGTNDPGDGGSIAENG